MSTIHYELLYFPARGRGEQIRLLFACAQVPFKNTGVTDWAALKAKMPLGQLPVLIEHSEAGELHIPQSGAIMRHLARTFGLYGENEREATMADVLAETVSDARSKFFPVLFAGLYGTSADAIEKYWSGVSLTLSVFDRLLAQSFSRESGLFVGLKPTFADVAAFDLLWEHKAAKPECLAEFPALLNFLDRFSSLPGVAEYLGRRA